MAYVRITSELNWILVRKDTENNENIHSRRLRFPTLDNRDKEIQPILANRMNKDIIIKLPIIQIPVVDPHYSLQVPQRVFELSLERCNSVPDFSTCASY